MKKLINVNELKQCPCFNFRKMARELTNSYNRSLKYSGINSTQIPILALLNIYNEIETAKIAKLLNFESSISPFWVDHNLTLPLLPPVIKKLLS